MPTRSPHQSKARDLAREVATGCLAFRARALSRKVTGIYEEALRPLPLRATQMNVMTAIAAAGDPRLTTVADMIAIEPSSLSRIVGVLRRNGWVDSIPDPDDERASRLVLSFEGSQLYAKAIPAWRKAQQKVRELMGEDEAEAFLAMANRSLSIDTP